MVGVYGCMGLGICLHASIHINAIIYLPKSTNPPPITIPYPLPQVWQARRVLPLLGHKHLLLVTLLLFNSAAAEALPIFLGG